MTVTGGLLRGAVAKNTWTLTRSSLVTPLYLLPYMMPSQCHTGTVEYRSVLEPRARRADNTRGSTTDQSSTAAVFT